MLCFLPLKFAWDEKYSCCTAHSHTPRFAAAKLVDMELHLLAEKKKGPMQLNAAAGAIPIKPVSERNELALQVLHQSGITPEHLETRTLYNDDCPGIPQVLTMLNFIELYWASSITANFLSGDGTFCLLCTELL